MRAAKLIKLSIIVGIMTIFSVLSTKAADLVRTVALQDVVGPAGSFAGFDLPAISPTGEVALRAVLEGAENRQGMFRGSEIGDLVTIVLSGDQSPDSSVNVVIDSFFTSTPLANSNQRSAFLTVLTGPALNGGRESAIVVSEPNAVVAREGSMIPAAGLDVNFDGLVTSLAQNKAGRVAFMSAIAGDAVDSSTDFGVFSEGRGNGLALIAREGDPAPVGRSGVNFSFPATARNLWSVALSDSGRSAFVGFLTGTRVTTTNNHGIFRDAGSELEIVVRRGDPATSAGELLTFGDFGMPSINTLDQTAFFAFLEGPGINESNEIGFFRERVGGDFDLVARDGAPAPGTEVGTTFDFNYQAVRTRSTSQLAFNNAGQSAFISVLDGPSITSENSVAIFSDGMSNELEVVARRGDAAAVHDEDLVYNGFRNLAFNSRGQAAFSSFLSNDAGATTFGIFAQDYDGDLQLIAKVGDLFDVSDDPLVADLRTISSLEFFGSSGNADGQATGFNDQAQLAFRAEFIDGTSGVFVSNRVAVPEPEALLLLVVSTTCLLLSQRRSTRSATSST